MIDLSAICVPVCIISHNPVLGVYFQELNLFLTGDNVEVSGITLKADHSELLAGMELR